MQQLVEPTVTGACRSLQSGGRQPPGPSCFRGPDCVGEKRTLADPRFAFDDERTTGASSSHQLQKERTLPCPAEQQGFRSLDGEWKHGGTITRELDTVDRVGRE